MIDWFVIDWLILKEIQQQNLAFYLTQEQANMVNNGRKVETNGMVVYKMHILLRYVLPLDLIKKSPKYVGKNWKGGKIKFRVEVESIRERS